MKNRTSPEVIRALDARAEKTQDELLEIEEEIEWLLGRRSRLQLTNYFVQKQIEEWHYNRKFEPFLRLPLEIRQMVYDHYIAQDTFLSAYDEPIVFVCKQMREEFLDWLGINRPLLVPLKLKYSSSGSAPTFSKPHHFLRTVWSDIPAQIVDRVRCLDIRIEAGGDVCCKLYVASGQVRFIESSNGLGILQFQGIAETFREKLQLVGSLIAKEGSGLRNIHLKWLVRVLTQKGRSLADMERKLSREVQARLSLPTGFNQLPFSDCGSEDWCT
ncbi:hypothetical protein CB0940_08641 [Cercospora beticola]|uniref:Uncharacterized protein n=1 Tax=Cercospora beticola TaxID=122368 RepID=A0A2G5HPZ2_CERBT|nr:hypothetical protein CB0940_08641 [Cercospora beticola]PIA94627.1 hypothetical protein CB0940_08641 [Cercospora beticola]WPB05221.1 hypothetical protein RHO25_009872 [Cercospora beticola]CAK1365010.1 unnamed protein product [Cercospora beticola]